MRETSAALTAHVGGNPSETQKQLIRQAVQLRLRLEVMDRTFAETRTQTEHDTRTYLAWSNTLSRTLRLLGLDAAPAKPQTLQEYLASKAVAS